MGVIAPVVILDMRARGLYIKEVDTRSTLFLT